MSILVGRVMRGNLVYRLIFFRWVAWKRTTLALMKSSFPHFVSLSAININTKESKKNEYKLQTGFKWSAGTDNLQQFCSILVASDALQVPGGFTGHCLKKGIRVQHITRHFSFHESRKEIVHITIFRYSRWNGQNRCPSHHSRNDICIFGLEDLVFTFIESKRN